MVSTTVNVIESIEPMDYPQFAALYEDEQLEVGCFAMASVSRGDYGVPGSPVWDEIDDIEIVEYEINGVGYSPEAAQQKFGVTVEKELNALCSETAEREGDWV